MIKFVSDLKQVGGFRRILRFPPPIKLTALLKVALNTIKKANKQIEIQFAILLTVIF
jgi:hypothetical protein